MRLSSDSTRFSATECRANSVATQITEIVLPKAASSTSEKEYTEYQDYLLVFSVDQARSVEIVLVMVPHSGRNRCSDLSVLDITQYHRRLLVMACVLNSCPVLEKPWCVLSVLATP